MCDACLSSQSLSCSTLEDTQPDNDIGIDPDMSMSDLFLLPTVAGFVLGLLWLFF
jgi:hypothetical protein